MLLGRTEDAINEGKKAVELEPLNLNHGANLSGMYFYARQYDRAFAEAKQVFDLTRTSLSAAGLLVKLLLLTG